MNMTVKRALAVFGVVTLAVSLAGPATAKPKKPKKITTEQLQALILSPAEAAQAAGYTGTLALRDGKPAECFPNLPGVACAVSYSRQGAGSAPFFIRVSVFPTVAAARAAVSTLPGAPRFSGDIVSQSPNEIVAYIDRGPEREPNFVDELARVAVVGRFVVTTVCIDEPGSGTLAGLQGCATGLANAQAKKLTPYQPQPAKKKS